MGEGVMEALVTALQQVISADALLTTLTDFIPVIGGLIAFAFIYRVLRKVVKGASKGKASI